MYLDLNEILRLRRGVALYFDLSERGAKLYFDLWRGVVLPQRGVIVYLDLKKGCESLL